MPDSQTMVRDDPTRFAAQTAWIAANAVGLNIRMVVHLGDIVNTGATIAQWVSADSAWDTLDTANIPYQLALGNHDDDENCWWATREVGNYNTYFGQGRYTGQDWWAGGFFEEAHAENAYNLFTAGGKDYILITLEVYPRAEALAWASGLLTTYADREAIIVTHNYMYTDDTRQHDPEDDYGPDDLFIGGTDGEGVWSALAGHDNIVLILSGHQLGDGTGILMSYQRSNSAWQILSNYQGGVTDGDDASLRIMTIKPSTAQIDIKTYSVDDSAYRTEADQQYTLNYRYRSV